MKQSIYLNISLVLSIFWLSACSSQPPQTVSYLLSTPEFEVIDDSMQKRVVVGDVEVASYLAGKSLTQALNNQQIHRSRQHQWAEPLHSQLQRQLRHGLTQQLAGSDWLPVAGSGHLRSYDLRLDLHIDSFHLLPNGEVEVAGIWQARNYQQDFFASGRFSEHQQLAEDGYDAMVEALEIAWQRSMQEVATQLLRTLNEASESSVNTDEGE
ncbi:hypothetical protein CWE12_05860 [Aliidiomarina sedimenti]|uniref:ABC-type transport auxiliary lipoprotein component domain-containing protein n=1 Tax=Aliidiomarina sedimenti TaxID=1933879 RepID=A0ABY0C0L9_9GAMM|nr:ABC-type transport auxiliary lipoprotein family protein [Aliidiomarina sedimenti]RUO30764.1 hypothetical protein CWE12_05860 [Aliidiomarina sedimenti]